MAMGPTREEIDDFIDSAIKQFEDLLDALGEEAVFQCPITGKKLKGNEVLEHLDVFTRERMYEESGVIETEQINEAYERAMRGI